MLLKGLLLVNALLQPVGVVVHGGTDSQSEVTSSSAEVHGDTFSP